METSITVAQAKEKLYELQEKVRDLVREFEAQTQTTVHGIQLSRNVTIGGAFQFCRVDIEVRLR